MTKNNNTPIKEERSIFLELKAYAEKFQQLSNFLVAGLPHWAQQDESPCSAEEIFIPSPDKIKTFL